MADKIGQEDDPGNLSTQTSALLDRPAGGGGGGMGNYTAPKVTPRDYTAGYRAMGYSDPAGEGPGHHQVQTPEGRAPHGSDVPGTGVPGPAEGIARLAQVRLRPAARKPQGPPQELLPGSKN